MARRAETDTTLPPSHNICHPLGNSVILDVYCVMGRECLSCRKKIEFPGNGVTGTPPSGNAGKVVPLGDITVIYKTSNIFNDEIPSRSRHSLSWIPVSDSNIIWKIYFGFKGNIALGALLPDS